MGAQPRADTSSHYTSTPPRHALPLDSFPSTSIQEPYFSTSDEAPLHTGDESELAGSGSSNDSDTESIHRKTLSDTSDTSRMVSPRRTATVFTVHEFSSELAELDATEAFLEQNPSRDALAMLKRSTRVVLAVSRLRSGLRSYGHINLEEAENIFYERFVQMTDDQLTSELVKSVRIPSRFQHSI